LGEVAGTINPELGPDKLSIGYDVDTPTRRQRCNELQAPPTGDARIRCARSAAAGWSR
jgi:hypothetical protein